MTIHSCEANRPSPQLRFTPRVAPLGGHTTYAAQSGPLGTICIWQRPANLGLVRDRQADQ